MRGVAALLLVVTATAVLAAPGETYRARFGTTVHAEPDAGSTIVKSLTMDERIEVLGPVSGSRWLVVGEGGREIGYVFGPTVEKLGVAKPSATEALADEQGIDRATAKRLQLGLRYFEQENWAKAYEVLVPLAQEGVTEAQFRLGKMYQRGRHIRKSPDNAFAWLSRAAAGGHPAAQNDLGTIYFDRGDLAKATALFRKAAEQEYCRAQVNLGGTYYEDRGTDQNMAHAAYWFARASRCDDFSASLEGDRWVRKLDMMARDRQRNYKNDVLAAGILLALAVGVLGAAGGGSDGGSTTPGSYDPCDDPSITMFVDQNVVRAVCGK